MVATELIAPPSWRCIDFISDLHLHASDTKTFLAWESYLTYTTADAVFILGDLFEVWVGDDCLLPGSFEQNCADVLRRITSHVAVYVMHGNRDFLLGAAFMKASGCIPLQDPTVLGLGDTRLLLTHGDGLCLDDIDYQDFRKVVRSTEWQSNFLSKPLVDRKIIANGIRSQSEGRKKTTEKYADADTAASITLMDCNAAQHMIHGHTHRPHTHIFPLGCTRIVLSDWDLTTSPPRAEVLRLQCVANNHWTTSRENPMAIATP
jgi:UDP-2,3-diacylglucosamine hydrolase